MKQHLVNLLIEEYKQILLVKELKRKGIDVNHICVDNFGIVLDIIGFPKDNTSKYDFGFINSGGEIRDKSLKIVDEYCFSRDIYYDKFHKTIDKYAGKQKISKLDIHNASSPFIKKVELKLSTHVDLLYDELKKLNN